MSLEVAVVTGAGLGLGRALSVELCARGCQVAGLARTSADLEATAAASGERFTGIVCDVSDPEAVHEAFRNLRDRLGPVDILMNNAAVYPRRDFLDESAESFMATIGINLGGVVSCTREALSDMIERGQGRIVNVASFAGERPIAAASAYSVSKGAGQIFTRALVADLADRFPRIVITDWVPGPLRTRMGPPEGIAPERAARWGASLALMRDATLTGTLWEMDQEVLPPRPIRRRVLETLLGLKVRASRRVD